MIIIKKQVLEILPDGFGNSCSFVSIIVHLAHKGKVPPSKTSFLQEVMTWLEVK